MIKVIIVFGGVAFAALILYLVLRHGDHCDLINQPKERHPNLAINILLFCCAIAVILVIAEAIRIDIGSAGYASGFALSESEAMENGEQFVELNAKNAYSIVYDIDTKVKYVVSEDGDFTVLVDANGDPLIYDAVKESTDGGD